MSNNTFIYCRYKSAEPKNLWDSFDTVVLQSEEQFGILGNTISVEEFMNSWMNQAGYPVIYVETNNNDNCLIVTQVHFIL